MKHGGSLELQLVGWVPRASKVLIDPLAHMSQGTSRLQSSLGLAWAPPLLTAYPRASRQMALRAKLTLPSVRRGTLSAREADT